MWRWLHRSSGCVGDRCFDFSEWCLRRAREVEHRRRIATDGPPAWLGVALFVAFLLGIAGIVRAIRWLTA